MTYHPMTIPASQVRTGHTVVLANGRRSTVIDRRNIDRKTVEITIDLYGERTSVFPREQPLTVWAWGEKPVKLDSRGMTAWPPPSRREP